MISLPDSQTTTLPQWTRENKDKFGFLFRHRITSFFKANLRPYLRIKREYLNAVYKEFFFLNLTLNISLYWLILQADPVI